MYASIFIYAIIESEKLALDKADEPPISILSCILKKVFFYYNYNRFLTALDIKCFFLLIMNADVSNFSNCKFLPYHFYFCF